MDTRIAATQKRTSAASRLDRRLIELNEYAKREGITPQDVRRCSEIGIIQLRSHKGKTFVVDMPVCSFDNTDQIDAEVAQLLGLIPPRPQTPPVPAGLAATERISNPDKSGLSLIRNLAAKLLRNVRKALNKTPDPKQASRRNTSTTNDKEHPSIVGLPRRIPICREKPGRPSSEPYFQPGAISQLVQEMLQRAEQIKIQEQMPAHKQTAPPITDAQQPSQNQKSPVMDEVLTAMHRQLDQIETSVTQPPRSVAKQ
jgi:hypothetical protein